MKVVLFCGGLGMRLKEYSEQVPKPLATIGYRPLLWHVMKYYAHFGHKEFIICLGFGADAIKSYFLNYSECLSNDFVFSEGGRQLRLLSSDIHDWNITFVDTGIHANIGQRLKAVEQHLEGDDVFLANYSDGLTDLPLPEQIEHFRAHGPLASFLCVRPNLSLHFVSLAADGAVASIQDVATANLRVNGGYFIFHRDIMKYIRPGEDLLQEPFQRLLLEKQLLAYCYDGFWACLDTFKDKLLLDDLYAKDRAPWELWKRQANAPREVPLPVDAALRAGSVLR